MKSKDRFQKITSRTLKTSIRRMRSLLPLVIDGDNVSQDPYQIDPNETFLVVSLSNSHVIFHEHQKFDDHDIASLGFYSWTPKKDQTGEAHYHTVPKSGKVGVFATHSIKIGSGTSDT